VFLNFYKNIKHVLTSMPDNASTALVVPIRQRFCSKRPCWCTNVGTVWLRLTCRLTACQPHHTMDGRCHLRSAASGQLSVPRKTTNYGDRRFAVSGPTVWNSLPAVLRLDMSLSVFRTRLKTFLMT